MTDIVLYCYTNTAVGAGFQFDQNLGAMLVRTHYINSWRGGKRVGWSLMEQMIGLRFKERVREETPQREKLD